MEEAEGVIMKLLYQMNKQLIHRRIVLILIDIMMVCVASIAPLWFRFAIENEMIPKIYLNAAWNTMVINIIVTLVVFYIFRLFFFI